MFEKKCNNCGNVVSAEKEGFYECDKCKRLVYVFPPKTEVDLIEDLMRDDSMIFKATIDVEKKHAEEMGKLAECVRKETAREILQEILRLMSFVEDMEVSSTGVNEYAQKYHMIQRSIKKEIAEEYGVEVE